MSALAHRVEVALRITLIVVVMFNALIPSAAASGRWTTHGRQAGAPGAATPGFFNIQ